MKYEQIAFLDLDGVFQCQGYTPNEEPVINENDDLYVQLSKNWKKQAVECFYKLLKQYPELKIVVSSSQRHQYTHKTIKNLFKYYPLIQERIIGKTISLNHSIRGKEIQHFLDNNEVSKFVIIDDNDDMGELYPQLVQTDFKIGFSESDLAKAQMILG